MDNIVNFVDMEIDNNVLVNWVDHRNALLREFARIDEQGSRRRHIRC